MVMGGLTERYILATMDRQVDVDLGMRDTGESLRAWSVCLSLRWPVEAEPSYDYGLSAIDNNSTRQESDEEEK